MTLNLLRLFHVLTVGLAAGSLLSVAVLQSLAGRATDDAERRHLAGAAGRIARHFTSPMMLMGVVLGLAYWVFLYGAQDFARIMAATPVHVHMMLLLGILALGMTQMWKRRSLGFAAALHGAGFPPHARRELHRVWILAFLALAFTGGAWVVATLKIPRGSSRGAAELLEAIAAIA